jgi:hypothetical protein
MICPFRPIADVTSCSITVDKLTPYLRVPVILNHFSGVMAGLVPAIHVAC